MTDYLLDTNVLLRLSDASSHMRKQAVNSIIELKKNGNQLFITAQNIVEFWAVATRPIEVNGFGWTTQETFVEVSRLQSMFPLLVEVPEIFRTWIFLAQKYAVQGKKVHDLRLVAVMQSYDIQYLLTFNGKDFKRYTSINPVDPASLSWKF